MTALVLRRDDLADLAVLGEALVESRFFKDITKVSEAVVKIIAGRELGMGPVEAMRSFHVIQGKVDLTAGALAARVKASGGRYDYRVLSLDDFGCELAFYEGGVEVGRSSFTESDRARAGLALTDSHGDPTAWSKYPRSMMFARALTNGVGFFCPDVALGGPAASPDARGLAAREPDPDLSGLGSTITVGDVPEPAATGDSGPVIAVLEVGAAPAVALTSSTSASGTADAYGEGADVEPEATTSGSAEGDEAPAAPADEQIAPLEPCSHPNVKPSPREVMASRGWVVCIDCPASPFQVDADDPRWPGARRP
jgi:hypothetical protein